MSAAWIAAFSVLAAVVTLNCVLVVGLIRRTSPVLESAERQLERVGFDIDDGLPLMGHVPPFTLRSSSGDAVASSDLLTTTTIFLFVDAGCSACRHLLDEFNGVDSTIDGVPLVVVLPLGDEERLELPPRLPLFFQERGEVSAAFRTSVTPRAFVVYPNGAILERRVPQSIHDLRQLALHQSKGGDASLDDAGAVSV